MKDGNKNLQLILIEDELGKIKRYQFSKKRLKFLIKFTFIFFFVLMVYSIFLTYLSFSYYKRTEKEISSLRNELAQYKEENKQLKTELSSLKEEKENALSELAKRIEIIDSLMKKVGVKISSEEGGKGGLAIPIDELLKRKDIDISSIIPSLDYIIHNLRTIPLGYPTVGKLTSDFGLRRNPITKRIEFHLGVDLAGTWGTPVRATADGVVVKTGWCGPMGKCLIIKHSKDFSTYYGHLAKFFVKKGDFVEKGQIIGMMGNSGRSTGPHLHYTVRFRDKVVNPLTYMEVFNDRGKEE
ncbi:MAG: peptidoglycan DD-metalloendopeptidase family protein [Desulfurobacteriaceae bacterium]